VEGPPARADSERQPNRLPFGQTDHDYHLLFDVSGPVWPNFQGGSTWINSPFGRRVGGPLGTVGARETPAEPPIISLTKNIFSCESKGLFNEQVTCCKSLGPLSFRPRGGRSVRQGTGA
jgi:hypothetical protein